MVSSLAYLLDPDFVDPVSGPSRGAEQGSRSSPDDADKQTKTDTWAAIVGGRRTPMCAPVTRTSAAVIRDRNGKQTLTTYHRQITQCRFARGWHKDTRSKERRRTHDGRYYTPLALTSPPRGVITYITEGDLREACLAQLSHLSLPPSEPVHATSKLDVGVTEALKSLFLFKPPLSDRQPHSGQSRRHNAHGRWRVQWVVRIDKSV